MGSWNINLFKRACRIHAAVYDHRLMRSLISITARDVAVYLINIVCLLFLYAYEFEHYHLLFKVRESEVLIEKKKFYSLELRGPLLPHVLPSLCSLMKSSARDNFSVSCAQLQSTTSFSKAKHGQGEAFQYFLSLPDYYYVCLFVIETCFKIILSYKNCTFCYNYRFPIPKSISFFPLFSHC